MSLKTWKAEFYPIPANETPKEDALDHSIRKWEGLQPDALEKHGLALKRGSIQEFSEQQLYHHVNGADCALCVHYFDKKALHDDYCLQCPIVKHTKRTCCEGWENPWSIFVKGNATPMLELLYRVKKGL